MAGMKGDKPLAEMMRRALVTLEPELEREVALYTPAQRMELARKLKRWARQLRVSAFILRRAREPRARVALRVLPRRRLSLN